MNRNLLAALALLLSSNALAGGLVKAYVPAANEHVTSVRAAYAAIGKVGTDARSFLPVALSLKAGEVESLLQSVKLEDTVGVRQQLEALEVRARENAAKAVAQLALDLKEGRIADSQLGDAKELPAEFLAVYGSYLFSDAKFELLKAAAALEKRRLQVEEKKETDVNLLMVKIAAGLEGLRSEQYVMWALGHVVDDAFRALNPMDAEINAYAGAEGLPHFIVGKNWLRRNSGVRQAKQESLEALRQALRAGDDDAFRAAVSDAYARLEFELSHELGTRDGTPPSGPGEDAWSEQALAQARELHDFIAKLAARYGRPDATILSVHTLGMDGPLVLHSDVNDVHRDALVDRIRTQAPTSQELLAGIEAKLPQHASPDFMVWKQRYKEDHPSLRQLSATSRLVRYYQKVAEDALRAPEYFQKQVRAALETGFGGKAATDEQLRTAHAVAKAVVEPLLIKVNERAGGWFGGGVIAIVVAGIAAFFPLGSVGLSIVGIALFGGIAVALGAFAVAGVLIAVYSPIAKRLADNGWRAAFKKLAR